MHGPERLLAVSANSHEITVFDLKNGNPRYSDENDICDEYNASRKSRREGRRYTIPRKSISMQNSSENTLILKGHENNIPNISFSECGRFLVSCSIDRTCRTWNVKTGRMISKRKVSHLW